MKTAVSIPDELFDEVEQLAALRNASRSKVFSQALREYVDRHAPQRVTEAMNTVVDTLNEQPDQAVKASTAATLKRSEW
ncbi:MAG: CopG family ribbon-helix-helix protein [Spirochaetaceae bacterium]